MVEGDNTIELKLEMMKNPKQAVLKEISLMLEFAPPAVNTDLDAGLNMTGGPLDAFAEGIFKGLAEGKKEIGYGTSVDCLRISRDDSCFNRSYRGKYSKTRLRYFWRVFFFYLSIPAPLL